MKVTNKELAEVINYEGIGYAVINVSADELDDEDMVDLWRQAQMLLQEISDKLDCFVEEEDSDYARLEFDDEED